MAIGIGHFLAPSASASASAYFVPIGIGIGIGIGTRWPMVSGTIGYCKIDLAPNNWAKEDRGRSDEPQRIIWRLEFSILDLKKPYSENPISSQFSSSSLYSGFVLL